MRRLPVQTDSHLSCPLCATAEPTLYHRDHTRSYWQCIDCDLVFVPPEFHLDTTAEKAYYDLHENDPADPRYRRFLSRLAEPLLTQLSKDDSGLDFGCGPGPALAQMLAEAGMTVHLYDHFYVPDASVWEQRYDFITATEVFEHLHAPMQEIERLFAILKPGGWLGIMTKRVRNQTAFTQWHYITDPTHICYYSEATFAWIATRWNAELAFPAADVALLQKRP